MTGSEIDPPKGKSRTTLPRKKRGRVLSNLYKLTLPKHALKRNETVLSEFWEDVDNLPSSVALCDGYPSHSATPHSRTAHPPIVAQCDTIIHRSSKDHPGDHNPPETGGEIPGRFELRVARPHHVASLLPSLGYDG